MPRIRVVTFDLDNTLWNADPVILAAERRMAAWLAERVPEAMPIYQDREAVARIRTAMIREQPAIVHDVSRLRQELVYRCMRRAGMAPGQARRLAKEAFRVFLDARHDIEFFDGALEALQRLSRRYRLGSLTNGNADPKRLRLDRLFTFSFSAASVGAGKPAPAMFEKVLSHNGVRAGETVHIGDHPIDDIQGASNVGMHTVWINGPNQRPAHPPGTVANPTVRVEHLDELDEAIGTIEQL